MSPDIQLSGAPSTAGQVTVDQRALVDKMLARYSGEFTVFRELLQNADDAESTAIEIRFNNVANQTDSTFDLDNLEAAHVTCWTIKNDGKPFQLEDWKRITTIAAGNTDSRKIGAFGVGFYSVFSVTDNPCISSQGGEPSQAFEMRFNWDTENQLRFVQRPLSQGMASPETECWKWDAEKRATFSFFARDGWFRDRVLDNFNRITASEASDAATRKVYVFLGDHRIGSIEKLLVKSPTIKLPEGIKDSDNKEIVMNVKEIQHYRITTKAEILHKNSDKEEVSMFTAKVNVDVVNEAKEELVRCIKKPPPPELDYSIIYSGEKRNQRSGSLSLEDEFQEYTSVFQALRADQSGSKERRVYIGHATAQTTGIGGHMASRFIPTVERELIDFSGTSDTICQWNRELLRIGGMLCRAIYEWELSNIQQLWEQGCAADTLPTRDLRNRLNQHFLHVLQFFTFHDSTPAPEVAKLLARSFFGCTPNPLMLLSSVGVRDAPDIRHFDRTFSFLTSLPMLSEQVTPSATIASWPGVHKIHAVGSSDVQRALKERPLNEEGLVLFLQWWMRTLQKKDSSWTKQNLLHSASLVRDGKETLDLSSVYQFIDPRGLGLYIPPDGPLPELLLPLTIYQRFSRTDFANIGWQEFTAANWLQYLLESSVTLDPRYDFTRTIAGAEQVLGILCQIWPSLLDDVRLESRKILGTVSCVPTIHGMRRPEYSYLLSASDSPFGNLELATVKFRSETLPNQQQMELLLGSIGVRRHIPPDVLRDRMRTGLDCSVYQLIRYLIRERFPMDEVDILRSLALFTAGKHGKHVEKKIRFRADELYPPEPIFRALELPMISWDDGPAWSSDLIEAKFLYDLGLRHFPPLDKIVELCRTSKVSNTAFQYFYSNLEIHYSDYSPDNFQDTEFIPATNSLEEGRFWKKLDDVCWDVRWSELGFFVVDTSLPGRELIPFDQLGIQQHPSPAMLLDRLRSQQQDEKTASQRLLWFECLADCIADLQPHLDELSGMHIVPTKSSGSLQWKAPTQCYLAEPKDEFIGKLFTFVKFGEKGNQFLSACGSKQEPSVKEVVESLIDDPQTFHDHAGGHIGFLTKLLELAKDIRNTENMNETLEKMSSEPVLLGRRRKCEADGRWTDEYKLRKPGDIVIIDDTKGEELFSQYIWAVPKEDLETFYNSLGCRKLSKVIKEEYDDFVEVNDPIASEIKDLILDRLPIFLKQHEKAQPKVPVEALPKKLCVKACDKLRITKTFTIGEAVTEIQEVWAAAKHDLETVAVLWIARHAQRNMYDLSVSLCQILFGTFKHQDAFTLSAMFSDEKLLKNAGYVRQAPKQPVSYESKRGGDLMASVVQRGTQRALSSLDPSAPTQNEGHTLQGSVLSGAGTSGTGKSAPGHRSQIMSQDFIKTKVDSAIYACNSGKGFSSGDTHSKPSARYCGDQGLIGELPSHENVEGIEVYASVPQSEWATFLKDKHEPLGRFISIVTSLANVFDLQTKSLHIFHADSTGPIASNREGTIYLNLRFFEAWHDFEVKHGDRERAQSFWFLAIAHEIAHNIVLEHNADHEFWFSMICEKHAGALLQIQRSEMYQVELKEDWLSLLRLVCGFDVA